MACFICFVHKGISPRNNTAAARPGPPGKTSVVSDAKTLRSAGGPQGPVSSEVMPRGLAESSVPDCPGKSTS